ncbi:glycosyltransferase family 2 protein [Luteimonas terrae]|uniref:GT2 family glycosyltransferase n=1 Tax=Luteimonas terrae TaxID=1530191 RepID=A0ABU1XZF0_9GAMM|nr:glycosyltransferase family 2 protein [Luteimonas terrae]MDR7194157.1 GT2 family glycosyltransferase [Luteimonas terrae]
MIDAGSIDIPAGWTLVASSQISADAAGFYSDGSDPHLVFALRRGLAAGWYRLRIAVEGPLSLPSVYLDCGAGISEAERQDLDIAEGGGIDAVVRVGGPLGHLRFDPTTRPGRFSLVAIRFDAIPPSEAVWRMWRALRGTSARFDALLALPASVRAERLWPAYRTIEAGNQSAAYLRWLEANAEEHASAARTDNVPGDVVLTLVLLPGSDRASLRAAAADLGASLAPGVELLVPLAADTGIHPAVRVLASVVRQPMPGLDQARGRYISWIAADERIEPQALMQIRDTLVEAGEIALLYTDEDFVDASGVPSAPYFKPAWDPDLQYQHDAVGPSSFYRRDLLQEIEGAVREDGLAWPHLLPLRIADHAGDSAVRHLPLLARRHRAVPGPVHAPLRSTAPTAEQVAHALGQWRTAGIRAARVATETQMPRMAYDLPADLFCEIVIPTRDRVDLLSVCVNSILERTEGVGYGVAIVDNGSTHPDTLAYLDRLRGDTRVRIVRDDSPFNYSALNNRAVAGSTADVVVLLNNDIEIIEGSWLYELATHACRPGVGAVGAKLLYPDDTLQHAGVILGVEGVAAHPYPRFPATHSGQFGRALAAQRFSAVTAACLAVRREVFEIVNGLDTSLAVAFNDVDLCLRISEAGYRNLWLPWVWMYHHESASRGHEDNPEKLARFASEIEVMKTRWNDVLVSDPAYNPNLSLVGRAFSIDPSRSAAPVPRANTQVARLQ